MPPNLSVIVFGDVTIETHVVNTEIDDHIGCRAEGSSSGLPHSTDCCGAHTYMQEYICHNCSHVVSIFPDRCLCASYNSYITRIRGILPTVSAKRDLYNAARAVYPIECNKLKLRVRLI
jgi:hypothetical protein